MFTILPLTVCLYWCATFLLDWKRAQQATHVLAVFFSACTLLYLCHALFFNHFEALAPLANSVYAFCNIAVYPLYYLYICRLTDSHSFTLRSLAYLVPAAAIGIWAAVLNFGFPQWHSALALQLLVAKIVFIAQLVPICLLGIRRLNAFDRTINNYYSDTTYRSVKQTEGMMIILAVCSLISAISSLIGREYFSDNDSMLIVPSVAFTLLLYAVGYVGLHQSFSIDDLERDEKAEPSLSTQPESPSSISQETPNENSPSSDPLREPTVLGGSAAQELQTQLAALMAEKRPYLNPDLRLIDLALMLGVGRTTLSQLINQQLGQSFSDYINSQRVEHAKSLIADPSTRNLSYVQISEMSGFTTEASFYRAFKKHTGHTPKQWQQQERSSC